MADTENHDPDADCSALDLYKSPHFENRKYLYRTKRDDFHSNLKAVTELGEWKRGNDDYDYQEL